MEQTKKSWNPIVNLIKWIQESNDTSFKKEIAELTALQTESDALMKEAQEKLKIVQDEMVSLNNEVAKLQELANKVKTENKLEEYWNNKITPVNNYVYGARPAFSQDARLNIDPRIFFTNNHNIPTVSGKDDDTKALNALEYVKKYITYQTDITNVKGNEVWLFPFETLALRKGDCEDGAILIANIMLKSGIPYWRIRINAGDVKGGGHAYVTYLREADNLWYVMDWCYWPSESADFGLSWKQAENYFGIWFSFNTKYVFAKDKLDRDDEDDS